MHIFPTSKFFSLEVKQDAGDLDQEIIFKNQFGLKIYSIKSTV